LPKILLENDESVLYPEGRDTEGFIVDVGAGLIPGVSTVDDALGVLNGCTISCQAGLTEALKNWERVAAGVGLITPLSGKVLKEGASFGVKFIDEAIEGIGDSLRALCSFTEDTLVITQDGHKPISEIEKGDLVLAYNEETAALDYYPVTAVWAHQDDEIIYLVIDGELILTTPDHPFYTAEGEWVAVADLAVGEEVVQANGEYGLVESNITSIQTKWMYNLTVDTAHTYFVGDGQWLVHNDCAFANFDKALRHFIDHAEKLGFDTIAEYVQGANDLFNRGGILTYVRANGEKLFYDAATNEFGVLKVDGKTIKSFLSPDEGFVYWLKNIGGID